MPIVTRFRPKRADELIGGSIFWIVKHKLAARQTILGFAERETDRKTIIRLDPELVRSGRGTSAPIRAGAISPPRMRPQDFDGSDEGIAALPADLAVKLAALALI